MAVQTILDEIVRWKRIEIDRKKSAVRQDALQAEAAQAPLPRDFAGALRRDDATESCPVRLIAEVKRASPRYSSIFSWFPAAFSARARAS